MEPSDALSALRDDPRRTGIFCDFDGTLSDIVPVPSDARPLDGVPELLRALQARFALVALVSGRRAAELLDWFGPGVEAWGVHGAERTVDDRVELSPAAARHAARMAGVRRDAERRVSTLRLPGVSVEDKSVTVTLHYRRAAEPELAERRLRAVARELADAHGVRCVDGRASFELRPPDDFSKRTVVLDRVRALALRAAAFVGDDRVDIGAFDALDALESEGVAAVRVAVSSPEAPPELLRRADVVVEGPRGAVRFLERLGEP